jgi:hypothetical protein
MAIVLDGAQRDAVYGFVVSDLADAGSLAAALEAGEAKRAEWLRRNFEQAARLLDQIGWEKTGSRQRYVVELGDADVLALFGRLHERASRVIDDAISEFARAMLADAFCVAEVASRTLGGEGEPPLRPPRLWLIEGGQREQ